MTYTVSLALEPWASAVLWIEASDPDAAVGQARRLIAQTLGEGEASALEVLSCIGQRSCAHSCIHPLGMAGVYCCHCQQAWSRQAWLARGIEA